FTDPSTSEIYTLSLHDALPISRHRGAAGERDDAVVIADERPDAAGARGAGDAVGGRIPARLGDAGSRPRRPAVSARNVGDIEQRSEEHTSELQSRGHLVCRLLL